MEVLRLLEELWYGRGLDLMLYREYLYFVQAGFADDLLATFFYVTLAAALFQKSHIRELLT